MSSFPLPAARKTERTAPNARSESRSSMLSLWIPDPRRYRMYPACIFWPKPQNLPCFYLCDSSLVQICLRLSPACKNTSKRLLSGQYPCTDSHITDYQYLINAEILFIPVPSWPYPRNGTVWPPPHGTVLFQ